MCTDLLKSCVSTCLSSLFLCVRSRCCGPYYSGNHEKLHEIAEIAEKCLYQIGQEQANLKNKKKGFGEILQTVRKLEQLTPNELQDRETMVNGLSMQLRVLLGQAQQHPTQQQQTARLRQRPAAASNPNRNGQGLPSIYQRGHGTNAARQADAQMTEEEAQQLMRFLAALREQQDN